MTVCKPIATVYSQPDINSPQTDELLFGETAKVLEEKGIFVKIISEYGYTGWTLKTNLFGDFCTPNFRVCVPFADMLPQGKVGLAPYTALPYGAKVEATLSSSLKTFAYATHPAEHCFYMQISHLAPLDILIPSTELMRNRIVDTAKKYLNVQYRWGGRSHLGIDCSGLCFNAYYFNGITLWRDADIEKNINLRKIPLNTAQKGDLLFFKNHMALYLGNNKIIHASLNNGFVATENLKESPYMNSFICAATAF